MTKSEYNGWYNYETWAVNLWLDNDEDSQSYWAERAMEALDENDGEVGDAASDLSNEIEESIKNDAPELGACLYADLLGAALSEVNWY